MNSIMEWGEEGERMRLTEEQKKKVEANRGLVYKVVGDKVKGFRQAGIYSREDLIQIGYIGLCKAAATDRGGTFSTYAYRLIWHEICDTLIAAGRRQARETACDVPPGETRDKKSARRSVELKMDLNQAFKQAKVQAPPSTAKGMEAMRLMSAGYSSREIGDRMEASDKLVCAWVSKARKFLKGRREFMEFAREYGY